MQPIDPATLAGLPNHIGAGRLQPYITASGGDTNRAIRLYTWNVEASAALLGAFAALEVGMRNGIHDKLAAHYGQSDWWAVAPLHQKDRDEIEVAADYLDRKRGVGLWSPGHLVAELKVSFWEGLLVNRYHRALWEPALKYAFPRYGGRRGDLRDRLERLRLLRNRAAHHEPIHARDLTVDHRYMCELADFMSTDLKEWVASHSRLPSVIAGRAGTLSGARPSRF